MASILKRTIILSFSRFANQAVVLLSPLLLVRILSVGEYGAYREFLLYAGVIAPLVSFGIARALPYLLPKYPDQERVWVSQTAMFVLASSSVAIIAIFFVGDIIRASTSFDFVTILQLYIFFVINLDFIELYWLGKKRTDYVFYYSFGRMLARTAIVVITAFLMRDARSIVYSLLALEVVRFFLVFWYANYRRWFTFRFTRESLRLQISYFLPLGVGAVIETLNSNAGSLFISSMRGAEALAFYTIGVFATKIVDILRGSLADVIFPEIVEVKSAVLEDALPLWRRSTVWYCILLFPAAVIFSYYADAIVTVLFTDEYTAAIPVFSSIAFLLVVYCFDFHLPLRAQNANRFFVIGSIIALIGNLVLLYPMYALFGLVGPAIAFIVSRFIITAYLAICTSLVYAVSIRELVAWRDVNRIAMACLVCIPILVAGKYVTANLLLRAVFFGGLYLVAYFHLLRLLQVWDGFAVAREFLGAKRRG